MIDATLDLTNVNEAYDSDREAISELLDEAMAFLTAVFAEIRQSAAALDQANLARAAHALKGTSANIGANAVSALSAAIEVSAKAGELTGLDPTLTQLGQAIDAVRERVGAYKSGG